MEFKIRKGNIVDAKVDAIVLPANSELKEGSGASETIFKAAGRKFLAKACKEIGFCEMGSAVPTLGYELNSNYIIHAVVPKWIDGEHGEYHMLCAAYAAALEVADAMECTSMAFPLLASGNNGFDVDLAFEIAIKSIEKYQTKNLKDIQIIVFGNATSEKVKDKGYEVTLLPVDLAREKEKYEIAKRKQKAADEAKDAAQQFLEDRIKKGIDYFKIPENREKAFQFGVEIVKTVMSGKN
ncbi:MAG: macro domain-containing protein [Lachnospiraceae bacterium]|nr:macro domain-containing protein [Lachnospiraceae bacterium]